MRHYRLTLLLADFNTIHELGRKMIDELAK